MANDDLVNSRNHVDTGGDASDPPHSDSGPFQEDFGPAREIASLMPPGCSIKARISVLAMITGHRGIYSIEGCSDYARTKPNRWFCSEEDARDQAFRKSSGC
jgi:hypothetical protein